MEKYSVGIVGATGMVGQRFVTLLSEHPWFEIKCLAASGRSAGKTYREAVGPRWAFDWPIPAKAADMVVEDAANVERVAGMCDFVFCAVNMDKAECKALEEAYARAETPVVSNNSANRWTEDVPMLIPEINFAHAAAIEHQRARLGTRRGFIAVKPNCSIQGKTFDTWPEMRDNVIPFIGGEEEKSEREPLRIWGELKDGVIVPAQSPVISAQCIRVPVSDGHMAAVSVSFENTPDRDDILDIWANWQTEAQRLELPSAPTPFLRYFEEDNRPQTRLDRDFERGMGVTIGRLRKDTIFDYKFVALAHNTLRGAAGGGVLSAEYLCKAGYITRK